MDQEESEKERPTVVQFQTSFNRNKKEAVNGTRSCLNASIFFLFDLNLEFCLKNVSLSSGFLFLASRDKSTSKTKQLLANKDGDVPSAQLTHQASSCLQIRSLSPDKIPDFSPITTKKQ